MNYPVPENEEKRLTALHRLEILYTGSEPTFDRVAEMAQQIFGTESAAVSLVDEERQWFKSSCGLDLQETPRERSFCAHVIEDPEVMVVEDALADERFKTNPLVAEEGGIRFYAGAPITLEDGIHVGSLCVIDSAPRAFGGSDQQMLRRLADLTADLMEGRRRSYQARYLSSVLGQVGESVLVMEAEPIDPPGPQIVWVNEAFAEMSGYEREELIGKTPRVLQGPATDQDELDRVRAALENGECAQAETVNYRKDGSPYVASWNVAPVRDAEGEITHWASVQRDVTDQRAREEELEYRARHDLLTGLLARKALKEQLQEGIEQGTGGALLMIDLDHFKQINDTLGHSAGDQLLQEVAQRIEASVRSRGRDVAARIGGDEFVVWLPSAQTAEDAVTVAQQILDQIGEPVQISGREIFADGSIGIVPNLLEYDSAEHALGDADAAMYQAKRSDAYSLVVHNEAMTEAMSRSLRLESELRRAIERKEFEPFFLPVVELETGKLQGVEALARWRHPSGELKSPGTFLDVAEETGLIVPIGHQVIEQACAAVQDLRETYGQKWMLTLRGNFSRREFLRGNMRDFVEQMLDRYDMNPSTFKMEITEQVAESSLERDRGEVDPLIDLGVQMEIDDFGTEFSSFRSLLEFPVSGFKIDRELTAMLPESERGQQLLASVLDMGRRLDFSVTAEGIETADQLSMLQSMGCAYGQGYLFGRPVPVDEMKEMIDRPPWTAYW